MFSFAGQIFTHKRLKTSFLYKIRLKFESVKLIELINFLSGD